MMLQTTIHNTLDYDKLYKQTDINVVYMLELNLKEWQLVGVQQHSCDQNLCIANFTYMRKNASRWISIDSNNYWSQR